jgi:hypothetical protein
MQKDSFYASMKMVTGEEVLAQVMPCKESNVQFFVVNNPITISKIQNVDMQRGIVAQGIAPSKWMIYGNEDTVVVNKNHVVSISEMDKFSIHFYTNALIAAKASCPIQRKVHSSDNTGYVGAIDDERDRLEEMFLGSSDS